MGDQQKSKNYFFANLLDRIGLTTPPAVARKQIAPQPPANAPYPTELEAIDAIKQGFGYGSGNEPYIEGKRAQTYARPSPMGGDDSAIIGQPTINADMTKFGNLAELDKVRTLHAQTALAANRNPIAALGYNPQRIGLQTQNNPTNVAGMYDPDQDRAWVNVANSNAARTAPSTPTHESIHRGLAQMQHVDENWMGDRDKALAAEAAALRKKLPHDEENIVRYIMATQMGDPELGRGDAADAQRARALNMFRQQDYFFREPMARLQEIAAEQRKNRRPGGPR